ncbi:acyl carrier protein [Pseudomonas chlororaphis]|uniref:acyl carrier protein n=1 Tax=Pseudomonas chlororaphis TaxID=587753 RepID=UPI00209CA2FD|nr:acyl carrier protein [Pseudomonas chlororaphis]MCP1480963.1 acyl carrier protein [Pseudomonas chlororaphis]MCP1592685.1 acyl carrier protein [Pseudomonas chlororaphis]
MSSEGLEVDRHRVLAQIFNLMREVAPQSVQENPDIPFLEAGVDSMKLILLVTRLEDAFQIEFETDHLAPQFLGSPASVAGLLLDHYLAV